MSENIPAGNRRPEDYLRNPSVVVPETTVEYSERIGKVGPTTPGFSDGLGVSGCLIITHKDKDGNVKHTETLENVITYTGLKHIAMVVSGVSILPFRYIWLGTGGRDPLNPTELLPPDPSNATLVTFYSEGIAVTSFVEVLNNVDRGYQAIARYAYTFDFTELVHINEACIAVDSHAVTGTPILNRRTFYDRVMQPLDFLEIVWEISFTRYPKDKVT